MNEKLKVLRKLEEWAIAIQPSLRKFPKTARFTTAQRLENTVFECIDEVIQANLNKPERPKHILNARICTERLLLLIRISKALEYIDGRHYEIYSESLTEISKMLAGWARAKPQA
jgi:hypothetical protein